ncbi:MAG TPA: FAD-dependent 5-carboxymethylaminomethyl-2-thiouridine(34) oxidoreductase MnmC [Ottowia sp.]|uniref:FAD-dependent 5-carboxymethylaminomethyl-2-thiouridine(34) oxidoreductase MnmC n=1 Tax=Ottowia sp. TaxID=1898956 RepID=UPI002BA792F0|nr:FAD-dependent 5-carboxymethylaminomethyl-2-thiouridine(34) oxidoreductase MnmC [Ottowia sp.]HMN20512.1 FAD-dependent 5-carboxymethylaminomethyl-2-thiouridine(34) oxidoreductase MnmC [Ottowia sp.]
MSEEIVHWRADGTPVSPRFGDIYRSAGEGGLAQAREVFLRGCGLLPEAGAPAWAQAPRWAVLETGFGLGLNFLATWLAWREDARRPRQLFYSAVEAHIVEADDLLRSAAPFPELDALARELARQWHGLLPGVHRLSLDGECVHLTLAIGDVQPALAELSGAHDSIYLDGFSPERNPEMWSLDVLRGVTRLARHGARAASWCVARSVREHLVSCGFEVERVAGLPPKKHALRARLAPHWRPPPRATRAQDEAPTGRCVIVGAGLAGGAAARSLALRGWQVTVLDRANEPAAGASGLPAGVVAPHVSPDDRPLSRLTRAGARATLARAGLLLLEGVDFAASGVLERHEPDKRRVPAGWREYAASPATRAETLDLDVAFTRAQAARVGLLADAAQPVLWHARAGWVRPAALVRAMLATPGVSWRCRMAVARITPTPAGWCLAQADGSVLAEAELVIIAAGYDSVMLAGGALPLHALRGQLASGPMPGGVLDAALPPFPVNGRGSLIAHLPDAGGPRWVCGSTFERASTSSRITDADHAANRARLHALLPPAAAALDAQWADGRAQGWAGVRATLPDRLPAIGAWHPHHDAGHESSTESPGPGDTEAALETPRLPLHLCTGLGARGLTLAVLCGELLAAELHGEPLPVARSLARLLRARRFAA